MDLEKELFDLSVKATHLVNERLKKKHELQELSDSIEADNNNYVLYHNSAEIIKKAISDRRNTVCDNLSLLGTNALQYALGNESLEMSIVERDYRDSICADVKVVNKSTGLETPILGAKGGGVMDIVNTAMRIGILNFLRDPCIDGPIILDEPYKQLSKEYQPAIAELLNQIVENFDRQIILSTHNEFIKESGGQKIHVGLSAPDTSIVTEGFDEEGEE